MITTIGRSKPVLSDMMDGKTNARQGSRGGFTILELTVTTTISGFVLAAMVATFITFAIGSNSIAAYTDMSKDSRTVLEYFARDMRAAADVKVASLYKLVVTMPSSGSFYKGTTVTYDYDKNTQLFFRIESDSTGKELSNDLLLDGVEQFAFSYFNPLGNPISLSTESILLSVKSVQVDAEMVRDISEAEATDYIISARFMMRNRPVTE